MNATILVNRNYPGNLVTAEVKTNPRVAEKSYGTILAEVQNDQPQEDAHGFARKKPSLNNEKTYWELRLEKLQKRLEAEQEWFERRTLLEDSSQRLAERRASQAAALGLDDAIKPALPITGVPAELLLQLL